MILFNAEKINDMVETYIYEDVKGRNEEIHSRVEFLYEQLTNAMWDYQNGEIDKVLNSFQMCIDSEDEREAKKAVKGVKAEDVAFIATHYGLLYGLVMAENCRLNFYK